MDRDFSIDRGPEQVPVKPLDPESSTRDSGPVQAYEIGPYRYVVSPGELAAWSEVGAFGPSPLPTWSAFTMVAEATRCGGI
jgi:hypothetical protein